MPLMSAARVLKCLATVPDGWPGYHCVKASRMARYLRRLSLIAGAFWFGRSCQREYTMGQPLKCLFQNALEKCTVEKTALCVLPVLRNAADACVPAAAPGAGMLSQDGFRSAAPELVSEYPHTRTAHPYLWSV